MSTHHIYTKRHPQPQYQATDNEYDTTSSSSSSSHHNNMSRTSGPNAEIAEGIANLQKKNAKLERMMVKIGTKADTHEFRDKMTEEQKSAAILCKTLMSQMKQNTRADKQVMNKLTTQFDREWKKYQALVYDMDQKMKQVLNTVSHQDDDRSHTRDQEDDHYRQSQLQQQDMAIQFLEYDAQEIEQRHQQIAALESDVLEVAEMYKDLQLMVNEQQESIDVIENNIVATRDKTEAAAQELLEAESYQKKARRKKCCIVLILLVVIIAIIVVVVLLKK